MLSSAIWLNLVLPLKFTPGELTGVRQKAVATS